MNYKMGFSSRNSDYAWRRYGQEEPYYSILNCEDHRSDVLTDDKRRSLIATGEARIRECLQFAEERLGPVHRGSALDYGCGVGRLTLALASNFNRVTALDISPAMLKEVERNSREMQVSNVDTGLADESLSAAGDEYDFAISYLVLQHIPEGRGIEIMRSILRRLRPDGVAALHFVIARNCSITQRVIHRIRIYLPPLHYAINFLRGMRWNEPLMQANCYDLNRVMSMIHREGFADAILKFTVIGDHVGVFAYCRKAK